MEEKETIEELSEESLEESLEGESVEESEESSEEITRDSSNESFEFDYDRLEAIVLETKDTFNQPLATVGLLSILGFVALIIFAVILLKEV